MTTKSPPPERAPMRDEVLVDVGAAALQHEESAWSGVTTSAGLPTTK